MPLGDTQTTKDRFPTVCVENRVYRDGFKGTSKLYDPLYRI